MYLEMREMREIDFFSFFVCDYVIRVIAYRNTDCLPITCVCPNGCVGDVVHQLLMNDQELLLLLLLSREFVLTSLEV